MKKKREGFKLKTRETGEAGYLPAIEKVWGDLLGRRGKSPKGNVKKKTKKKKKS